MLTQALIKNLPPTTDLARGLTSAGTMLQHPWTTIHDALQSAMHCYRAAQSRLGSEPVQKALCPPENRVSILVPVDVLLLLLKAGGGVQDVQHAHASPQGHQQDDQQNDHLKQTDLRNCRLCLLSIQVTGQAKCSCLAIGGCRSCPNPRFKTLHTERTAFPSFLLANLVAAMHADRYLP